MSQKKAAIGIVNYHNLILVVKKEYNPLHPLSEEWHIPGEKLHDKENFIDAIARGIQEEANIDVRVGEYLTEHINAWGTLVQWYECAPLSTNARPGSDISDVAWVPRLRVSDFCGLKSTKLWPKEVKHYFSRSA